MYSRESVLSIVRAWMNIGGAGSDSLDGGVRKGSSAAGSGDHIVLAEHIERKMTSDLRLWQNRPWCYTGSRFGPLRSIRSAAELHELDDHGRLVGVIRSELQSQRFVNLELRIDR